jgi:membrane-associated PAP2 superfamily phosphatase
MKIREVLHASLLIVFSFKTAADCCFSFFQYMPKRKYVSLNMTRSTDSIIGRCFRALILIDCYNLLLPDYCFWENTKGCSTGLVVKRKVDVIFRRSVQNAVKRILRD